MTESECITAIRLAVPSDRSDADAIAKVFLQKAVKRLGRLRDVGWNRSDESFSLTGGQSVYNIGSDVLTNMEVNGVQVLWRTDGQYDPIEIVDVQEFNKHARGSTSTGNPVLATVYSDEEKLEVWPTPNASMTVWAYVRKGVSKFEDIPDDYHDVLIDYAVASVQAASNPKAAIEFARAGLQDVKEDSMTTWTGNTIPVSRHIGHVGSGSRATSYNLRGD